MKMSMNATDFTLFLQRQFYNFFPDKQESFDEMLPLVEDSIEQITYSFSMSRMKFAHDAGGPRFSHLNTDQYAVFLCLLAQTAYRNAAIAIAEKAYAMNKALHGLDVFYEIALPKIFAFAHPVGTVLGRGEFSDYLCVYQGVTIGANLNDVYPTIGRGVALYAGSMVMGASRVGDNCMIAAGSLLMDMEVPDNHVAFGRHPHVELRPNRRDVIRDIFKYEATA